MLKTNVIFREVLETEWLGTDGSHHNKINYYSSQCPYTIQFWTGIRLPVKHTKHPNHHSSSTDWFFLTISQENQYSLPIFEHPHSFQNLSDLWTDLSLAFLRHLEQQHLIQGSTTSVPLCKAREKENYPLFLKFQNSLTKPNTKPTHFQTTQMNSN